MKIPCKGFEGLGWNNKGGFEKVKKALIRELGNLLKIKAFLVLALVLVIC